MKRTDAVIIGAGLNGLVAAARLAEAGVNVLVLERSGRVGGAHASAELAPGFKAPTIALSNTYFPAELIREFGLAQRGLRMLRREGSISLFGDGTYLAGYADEQVMRREIARHSRRDADAWPRFTKDMRKQAAHIKTLLLTTPVDPSQVSLSAIRKMIGRANEVFNKSPEELYDLTRFWSLSVNDLLAQYFESEALISHLAAGALIGHTLGPDDPTGAALLAPRWFDGDEGGMPWRTAPAGGMQALVDQMADIARDRGVDIRCDAEVTDIRLVKSRARSLVLADGEEIEAAFILSDLDAKRSFLNLFQWSSLPKGFVEDIAHVRMEGAVARANFALKKMPTFSQLPNDIPALAGGLMIGGHVANMARAHEDWLDHCPPTRPMLEVTIPTLEDPSLAPAGGHIFSVAIQFVPHELHDGVWSPSRRKALMETVRKMIEQHAPDFGDCVIAEKLRVPSDMEDEMGYTRGDLSLGQMSLDQMYFNRPVPGASAYQSPVKNFYLCSASTHPAGLALGASGANAAAEILSGLRSKRS
ncbi:MAG: NAD(P)/FAD-dependent oxidoreductase [Alphaproteobacteria bacterium]|nr:NAD(P)/FAD-dependent oxidoreductase [Alphaproteobacteria bacterium]MBO6629769.1 NAD(P)/FAD-dependent oxidoreductase [Alphaproteobacteria bacterium]MDF1625952.1 NAD(P)/FAD-dependent oxidoreductase [Parvibaculaceae bacterium]